MKGVRCWNFGARKYWYGCLHCKSSRDAGNVCYARVSIRFMECFLLHGVEPAQKWYGVLLKRLKESGKYINLSRIYHIRSTDRCRLAGWQ